MGIRLARNLTSADSLKPGEWFHDVGRHIVGVQATVVIGCPLCGAHSDLTTMHKVAAGGEVGPAFACTNKACSFLEYVVLDSWGEVT